MKTIVRGIALWFLAVAVLGAATATAKPYREIIGQARAIWCPQPSPVEQCFVYPVPVPVQVHTEDNEFIAEVLSDPQGQFQVTGLKPGIYVLTVSAAILPPVYFLQYTSVTETIAVHKKDPAPIDFVLHVVQY